MQVPSIPYKKGLVFDRSLIILSMCFVYMAQYFLQLEALHVLLAFLVIFVFFNSLFYAKSFARLWALVFFSIGLIINVAKGVHYLDIIDGMLVNLPIIALLILAPIILIPLKISDYFKSLSVFLVRLVQKPKKLFGGLTGFIFIFGPILNMGTIRLIHEMVDHLNLSPKFLSKVYFIGYSTAFVWSPFLISVATATYYLDIPSISYIPYGILFAIIQLLVGNLLFMKTSNQSTIPLKKQYVQIESYHRKKVFELFFLTILLGLTMFIVEYMTKWPMLLVVSLVSIVFPLIWSIVFQKVIEFSKQFQMYKKNSVPVMNNEIVLFISVGFLGESLIGTAFSDRVQLLMVSISNISILLFIVCILSSMIILTFIGVHPLIIVTVLATQFDPSVIQIGKEIFVLIMMMGWSIATILSPVTPLNILVSGMVNEKSLVVGLKWNGLYLVLIFIASIVYAYGMILLF
ncbi:hypothetical protein [Chengkuizengella axinellae]|uniref:TRAP transporter large permease subunit n=1 Tax=Chengkuizengella axinellae TaxID=3064388 RepID=A0ABT9J1J5_9BACL|nr:hypothetical protein [Chengkuizengella sp. 2205SS18-9]MDP5275468.1 hypothetical protein [Chengkuizengella sp. 2205SS18-9]